ncbi:MAG: hypothetical protein QF464_13175, partial [Myxococcota bacterium]|nr:hypothetical protein [Myxococcota bacterium]
EKAIPVFTKHLAYTPPNRSGTGGTGNRIAATISAVCLKSLQASSAKSGLNKLARMSSPVPLKDFLGGEYTVQSVATNAVEGLSMMAAVDKAAAAGKLSKEYQAQKKKLISFLLELTGKAYSTAVETKWGEFLKGEAAKKAADKAAAAPKPAEAPKEAAPAAEKKAE